MRPFGVDLILGAGCSKAGADPLGWVWAAQTLMEAVPAHALVMLPDALLSAVRLPRVMGKARRRAGPRESRRARNEHFSCLGGFDRHGSTLRA